jgi:outer membrane protein assembly factor BamA
VKGELWGGFYQPLPGSWQLAMGVRGGRIFPFGNSIPATEDDRIAEILQLRDVTLTAGGPSDVRGWASRLLGPKVPDVLVSESGPDVVYSATRYLPLGGLSRLSGAIELSHPLGESTAGFSGHVFIDGARVWTADTRLQIDDVYDQNRTFFSTGVGLGLQTPVGPVRLSIGYKLNPSVLDLRDPGDVLAATLEGRPIEDVPERASRRFQLHLTVGRPF